MKKNVLLIALFLCGLTNAQKGTYVVSGYFNFYSDNFNNQGLTDYQSFSVSPKVGYQFKENWTLGLESSLGQTKYSNDNGGVDNRTTFYTVGAFLRYSKSLNETFSLFTDVGLGYQGRKERFYNNPNPEQIAIYNGFYTNLQPLLHLKIINNWGMNFGLGGISYSNEHQNGSTLDRNSFAVNFGRAYTLGIQKIF
jgi:hypothetical protein